jgi:hypothetical protein
VRRAPGVIGSLGPSRQSLYRSGRSLFALGVAFLPMPDIDHDGAYFSPGSAVGAVAKFQQLHLK